MRYLFIGLVSVLMMFVLSSISHSDDSPFCLTKAYLAKDITSSIVDGLDPAKINFAFPNARTPEEQQQAMEFVNKLMVEVMELMKTENDPVKVYNIIKDTCDDPNNKSI